jgi:class 3 adenylate cyclase
MEPETRYAKCGELFIAYQTIGDSPIDLVFIPGFMSHLECLWELPECAALFRRLASFSRLILFDKRGSGLSDRVSTRELPTLEERMDDLRAVLDAVGSKRAALVGTWEGGPMSVLFAATYPERTSALVLWATPVAFRDAKDFPWVPAGGRSEEFTKLIGERWGQAMLRHVLAPSVASDERFVRWMGRLERLSLSPGAAIALWRMNRDIDVRAVLPSIRVPTLVMHRRGDRALSLEASRWTAQQIPGARLVEIEGEDHLPFVGDTEALLGEIEEFLTGARRGPEIDRVLATILFTDVVGSTERARQLGDRRWSELLGTLHERVGSQVSRFRGRVIDTAGDGVFATFDGPARAIRCAQAIHAVAAGLGLDLRTGLHTGECEVVGDKVSGIAVHMGARVAAEAAPGEILVSSTVRDLVAGSGIGFEDRGTRILKGMPGEWRVFAVEG